MIYERKKKYYVLYWKERFIQQTPTIERPSAICLLISKYILYNRQTFNEYLFDCFAKLSTRKKCQAFLHKMIISFPLFSILHILNICTKDYIHISISTIVINRFSIWVLVILFFVFSKDSFVLDYFNMLKTSLQIPTEKFVWII